MEKSEKTTRQDEEWTEKRGQQKTSKNVKKK